MGAGPGGERANGSAAGAGPRLALAGRRAKARGAELRSALPRRAAARSRRGGRRRVRVCQPLPAPGRCRAEAERCCRCCCCCSVRRGSHRRRGMPRAARCAPPSRCCSPEPSGCPRAPCQVRCPHPLPVVSRIRGARCALPGAVQPPGWTGRVGAASQPESGRVVPGGCAEPPRGRAVSAVLSSPGHRAGAGCVPASPAGLLATVPRSCSEM